MDSLMPSNYTPKRLMQEFNKKFTCNISLRTMRYKIKILSGDYIIKMEK